MRNKRLTGTFILLVTSMGCGDFEGGGADSPDGYETDPFAYMQKHGQLIEMDASGADQTDKDVTLFFRNAGLPNTAAADTGLSSDTFLCVLTTVSGNFGDTSGGQMVVFPAGPSAGNRWQVVRGPNSNGAGVCTRWSNFTGPSGSVTWLSDDWVVSRSTDGTSRRSLWFGDATSNLAWMQGEFEGFAENLWIDQSTDPFTSSVLNVRTGAEDLFSNTSITGGARSVFVGIPGSGRLAKLYGWRGSAMVKGDAAASGTFKFAVGDPGGFSTFELPLIGTSICYLTRVAGDFNGSGDKVTIFQDGGHWILKQTGETYGTARCMAYDQR